MCMRDLLCMSFYILYQCNYNFKLMKRSCLLLLNLKRDCSLIFILHETAFKASLNLLHFWFSYCVYCRCVHIPKSSLKLKTSRILLQDVLMVNHDHIECACPWNRTINMYSLSWWLHHFVPCLMLIQTSRWYRSCQISILSTQWYISNMLQNDVITVQLVISMKSQKSYYNKQVY